MSKRPANYEKQFSINKVFKYSLNKNCSIEPSFLNVRPQLLYTTDIHLFIYIIYIYIR